MTSRQGSSNGKLAKRPSHGRTRPSTNQQSIPISCTIDLTKDVSNPSELLSSRYSQSDQVTIDLESDPSDTEKQMPPPSTSSSKAEEQSDKSQRAIRNKPAQNSKSGEALRTSRRSARIASRATAQNVSVSVNPSVSRSAPDDSDDNNVRPPKRFKAAPNKCANSYVVIGPNQHQDLSEHGNMEHGNCLLDCISLLNWTSNVKMALANQGIFFNDIEQLTGQITALEKLKDKIERKEVEIDSCLDEARAIVRRYDGSVYDSWNSELEKNANLVKSRYDKIKEHTYKLLEHLQTASDKLTEFKDKIDEFSCWLKTAQSALEECYESQNIDEIVKGLLGDADLRKKELEMVDLAAQEFNVQSRRWVDVVNRYIIDMNLSKVPLHLYYISPVLEEVTKVSKEYQDLMNSLISLKDGRDETDENFNDWIERIKLKVETILSKAEESDITQLHDQLVEAKGVFNDILAKKLLVDDGDTAVQGKLGEEFEEWSTVIENKFKELRAKLKGGKLKTRIQNQIDDKFLLINCPEQERRVRALSYAFESAVDNDVTVNLIILKNKQDAVDHVKKLKALGKVKVQQVTLKNFTKLELGVTLYFMDAATAANDNCRILRSFLQCFEKEEMKLIIDGAERVVPNSIFTDKQYTDIAELLRHDEFKNHVIKTWAITGTISKDIRDAICKELFPTAANLPPPIHDFSRVFENDSMSVIQVKGNTAGGVMKKVNGDLARENLVIVCGSVPTCKLMGQLIGDTAKVILSKERYNKAAIVRAFESNVRCILCIDVAELLFEVQANVNSRFSVIFMTPISSADFLINVLTNCTRIYRTLIYYQALDYVEAVQNKSGQKAEVQKKKCLRDFQRFLEAILGKKKTSAKEEIKNLLEKEGIDVKQYLNQKNIYDIE